MKKIDKIVIGTHNEGKFKEISDLLPSYIKKISPKNMRIWAHSYFGDYAGYANQYLFQHRRLLKKTGS